MAGLLHNNSAPTTLRAYSSRFQHKKEGDERKRREQKIKIKKKKEKNKQTKKNRKQKQKKMGKIRIQKNIYRKGQNEWLARCRTRYILRYIDTETEVCTM